MGARRQLQTLKGKFLNRYGRDDGRILDRGDKLIGEGRKIRLTAWGRMMKRI